MRPETRAALDQLRARLGPPLPRPGWASICPCGHVRDEDCVRHKPIGEPVDWAWYNGYDAQLDAA